MKFEAIYKMLPLAAVVQQDRPSLDGPAFQQVKCNADCHMRVCMGALEWVTRLGKGGRNMP